MRRLSLLFPSLIALALLAFSSAVAAQEPQRTLTDRELEHRSPEWATVEAHLPNPATASADTLELQGDVLRARRFPEDAIDYYSYAMKRGGDQELLIKKIGVTQLEMHRISTARLYFQRATKMRKKDAEAWNDLGAVEYLNRQYDAAIGDYKRAVKLERQSAIFHSNLGIAYFDKRDFQTAGKEIRLALKLNPRVFQDGGTSGVSAHVLSAEDRARFCFEMAKAYARSGNEDEMLRNLGIASEGGLDILAEMAKDSVLTKLTKDERVLLIVQNTKALRESNASIASAAGAVPALAPKEQ